MLSSVMAIDGVDAESKLLEFAIEKVLMFLWSNVRAKFV
jgi:hypothetical protein